MRLIKHSVLYFIVGLMIFACVEPYAPTSIANAPHLLVVDGFLNATEGTVNVTLSRTISLSEEGEPPMETNAGVSLETSDGDVVTLNEVLPGQYLAEGVTANSEVKYRLRINTAGEEYLSDFVPVKITPAIESVDIHPKSDDMEVTVTTSDPTGESKYYRWKFAETFEYTSPFMSSWILENQGARPRLSSEYINRCWRTDKSTGILVATSSGLTEDRITDFEMTKVSRGSLKLSTRYSIKVEQQALTPEGFAYWQGLYKTTEDVGGLFDPLPGQISGNIYNAADTKEVVVGFFSAATIESTRIFVDDTNLPVDYATYNPPYCELDTMDVADVPLASPRTILYGAVYAQGMPVIVGYTFGDPLCLDCRYHGGSLIKPEFWP